MRKVAETTSGQFRKTREVENMKFCRATALLLLFLIITGPPPAAGAGILDTRTSFNIAVPQGWASRKWAAPEVALEARSPEKDGLLLVLILWRPFASKFEAAAAFEEREEFAALSPVQTWTGSVHTASGAEGILRRYRATLGGREADMIGAYFGEHETWYGVLAVWPPEDEALGALLEKSVRNFRPGWARPAVKDPIEGLWRWHNGSLLSFGPGGAVDPSRIVSFWRKDYPWLTHGGQNYFLKVKLPGKAELKVVMSGDGKKMYETDGDKKTQIASRVE